MIGASSKLQSTTNSMTENFAMKVFAQTIGFDMVPVKSMSTPSGHLFYMDTLIDNKKSERKRKIKNIFNETAYIY
jgi:hypothetical protein